MSIYPAVEKSITQEELQYVCHGDERAGAAPAGAFQVERLGMYYLAAQIFTTGALLCWNFALSRIWAFKGS